jgi:hypothetical protein
VHTPSDDDLLSPDAAEHVQADKQLWVLVGNSESSPLLNTNISGTTTCAHKTHPHGVKPVTLHVAARSTPLLRVSGPCIVYAAGLDKGPPTQRANSCCSYGPSKHHRYDQGGASANDQQESTSRKSNVDDKTQIGLTPDQLMMQNMTFSPTQRARTCEGGWAVPCAKQCANHLQKPARDR